MLSHADCALIAQAVYRGPWSDTAALDVKACLLPREGELVVAIPGTDPKNLLDLVRDARALPSWVAGLGLMHSGFGHGAAAMWAKLDPLLRREGRITYTGHSLGAIIAEILAALHALHRPSQPFRSVVFAAPRAAWLNPWPGRLVRRGLEAAEYRRHGDPIPDVPARALGYLHMTRGTMIGTALPAPLANHAIGLYAADIKALGK